MTQEEPPAPGSLPDRIWVMGPTGAGKSMLTAKLAAILGVPPTHIDDVHWCPDWVESPREETLARIAALADGPRWVIDGNYSFVRYPLANRVQLFVWLDLPLRVTFTRLVRRGLSRSLRKTPCCNGNYETLWRTFLHRDSLLVWALTHFNETRQKAAETAAANPHVRLRSQREVDRWFKEVAASREARNGATGRI